MPRTNWLSDKFQPVRVHSIRLAILLAMVWGFVPPGRAFAQHAPLGDESSFDDRNSDSQSYPFDSKYDADYGRDRPADGQWGQSQQRRGERQALGRRSMGFHLRATEEGTVFVDEIYRGGSADRAGLRPGDKVLAIDGFEIGSRGDVKRALRRHDPDEDVELIIARHRRTQEIDVPVRGRRVDPAEVIAEAAEKLSNAVGRTAATVGSDVRRFSQAIRQEFRTHSQDRQRASVLDPYDRFSDTPEGPRTDIDDETSDDSGHPEAVIEIDVLPPGHANTAPRRGPDARRPAGGSDAPTPNRNRTRPTNEQQFDPNEFY